MSLLRHPVDESGLHVYLDAMYPSNTYAKRIAALEKQRYRMQESEQLERVHDAFLDSVPQVPRQLAEDLYEETMIHSREQAGNEDLFTAAYRLGTYVDLLALEFDERNEPLSDREWRVLGDTVSSYADELDMDIVSYVMQHLVERRLL